MNYSDTTSVNSIGVPAAISIAPMTAIRDFLTFKLGTEEYDIDILRLQEIRSYEAPTRMANMPAFIKGVVNLRGVIVPILDMRIKFSQYVLQRFHRGHCVDHWQTSGGYGG